MLQAPEVQKLVTRKQASVRYERALGLMKKHISKAVYVSEPETLQHYSSVSSDCESEIQHYL